MTAGDEEGDSDFRNKQKRLWRESSCQRTGNTNDATLIWVPAFPAHRPQFTPVSTSVVQLHSGFGTNRFGDATFSSVSLIFVVPVPSERYVFSRKCYCVAFCGQLLPRVCRQQQRGACGQGRRTLGNMLILPLQHAALEDSNFSEALEAATPSSLRSIVISLI